MAEDRTVPPSLAFKQCYVGELGSARWEGRQVVDRDGFQTLMLSTVAPYVRDAESQDRFAAELRSLASTGMSNEFLGRFLRAVTPANDWEVGEALACCLLLQDESRQVTLPWNMNRDRRTPQASLPGADLVGFCTQAGAVVLLLGEVKTSSDPDSPPSVMHRKDGLAGQIEEKAFSLGVQNTLIRWLHCRCNAPHLKTLFQQALARYLSSDGREMLLVGVLLRDTAPNAADLQGRGIHLGTRCLAPTRVELLAWYLPVPIDQWPKLVSGGAA